MTPEDVEGFNRLLPQLSTSAAPLEPEWLAQMAAAEGTHVLVARDDGGDIVGALTLIVYRLPSGMRARIEDVIVDSRARGAGTGEALTRAALELARASGAKNVDLTSRPSRAAAIRLYERVGFVERETRVFRFDLRSPEGP